MRRPIWLAPLLVVALQGALVAWPTAAFADRSADAQLARGAVLRSSDFPAGWRPKQAADFNAGESCGVRRGLRITARAFADFVARDDDTANTHVTVFATTAEARTAVRRSRAASTRSCLLASIRAGVKKLPAFRTGELKLRSVTMSVLPDPRYDDESLSWRVVIAMTENRSKYASYGDAVLIRKGRAVVTSNFTEIDKDFDPGLMHRLLSKVGARLAR